MNISRKLSDLQTSAVLLLAYAGIGSYKLWRHIGDVIKPNLMPLDESGAWKCANLGAGLYTITYPREVSGPNPFDEEHPLRPIPRPKISEAVKKRNRQEKDEMMAREKAKTRKWTREHLAGCEPTDP